VSPACTTWAVGKREGSAGAAAEVLERLPFGAPRGRAGGCSGACAAGEAGAGAGPTPTGAFLAARSALQNLGLSLREAEEALRGAPEDAPLEELVKYALTRDKARS
jgi:hypothetical protein